MRRAAVDTAENPDDAGAPGDPDKLRFLLGSQREILQDIARADTVAAAMDAFLTGAMGAVGCLRGFAVLMDRRRRTVGTSCRGMEPAESKDLADAAEAMARHGFPVRAAGPVPLTDHPELLQDDGARMRLRPPGTDEVFIRWTDDETRVGFAGFGPRLASGYYGEEDVDFLLGLAGGLDMAADRLRLADETRGLAADARAARRSLDQVREAAETSQSALDKQAYHLNALHEAMLELAALRETDRLMEAFLLSVMGAFGAEKGMVMILDADQKTFKIVCRGLNKSALEDLPADAVADMIRSGQNSRTSRIAPDRFARALKTEFTPDAAAGFSADADCMGLAAVGARIAEAELSESERALFDAFMHHFTVFLKGTRAFETIRNLNAELASQNAALKETVAELTASKAAVRVLESARGRITALIRDETEKARRFSLADCALILCFSMALGLLYNFANPEGIPLVPAAFFRPPAQTVDAETAEQKRRAGTALFVDARPNAFFEQQRIPGAVNLPPSLFDFIYMMKFSGVDPDRELIVYGRNISRRYDADVAFRLSERGRRNVRVLAAGLSGWRRKGYAVEP